MDLSPDLIDVLEEFENFGVEYLVVAAGRPQDLADLKLLLALKQRE